VQLGFHGGIVARVPRNCSLTGAATMGAALHRGPIALRPKCLREDTCHLKSKLVPGISSA
ncbi:hypothetical protein ACJX0J_041797, partial [Zea mays]